MTLAELQKKYATPTTESKSNKSYTIQDLANKYSYATKASEYSSFAPELNSFLSDIGTQTQGFGDGFVDKSVFEPYYNNAKNYKTSVGDYINYFESNRDKYDATQIGSIIDSLKQTDTALGGYLDLADYWNYWDNEAQWTAYNDYEGGKEKYDALIAERQSLVDNPYGQDATEWTGARKGAAYLEWLNDRNAKRDAANKRIAEIDKELELVDPYFSNDSMFKELVDYGQKVANSNVVYTPSGVKITDRDYFNLGMGIPFAGDKLYALVYDAVNGDKDAATNLYTMGITSFEDGGGYSGIYGGGVEGNQETAYLTPDEKKIFNYIYQTEGGEAAYNFYQRLKKSTLQGRRSAVEAQQMADLARNNKWGASIESVITSPLKVLSAAGQVASMATGDGLSADASYNRFSNLNNTIRQAVSENFSGVGKFAYNTAMSMADSLFRTAITGGQIGAGAALAIAGSSAFADGVINAKQRGLSDGKAFALGLIGGIAEAAFEKIGLDALFDFKTMGQSTARYALQAALAEGGEEVGTEITNIIADTIIAGDKSEFATEMQKYIDKGDSKAAAFAKVLGSKIGDVAIAGLSGALSGGGMSAPMVATNAVFNAIGDSQMATELAEYGVPKTKALEYVKAMRKLSSGAKVNEAILTEIKNNAGAVSYFTKVGVDMNAVGGTSAQPTVNELARTETAENRAKTDNLADDYKNFVNRVILEQSAKYGEAGADRFNAIWEIQGHRLDAAEYINAMDEAYYAGKNGTEYSFEGHSVEPDVAKLMYEAGVTDAQIAKIDKGFVPTKAAEGVDSKLINRLDKIAKAFGVKIAFTDELRGGKNNGQYRDGTILIARDAVKPYMVVAKHEITHHLKTVAPEAFKKYADYAVKTLALGRDTEAVINARIAKANGKMSRDVAIEELAADFTEKILGDRDSLTSFINEMNKTSEGRNTLQKIFDAISNFLKKMKEVFRGDVARVRSEAFASLNFEQNFKEVVAQLEEAEALWKELAKAAITESETAKTKNTADDSGVRLSEKGKSFKEDKYFARQMDKWSELKNGARVKVGIVQENSALNRVGLPASGMYFDVGKIKKSMEDHSDHLTEKMLKQIPNLLNDPIVIAEYKGKKGDIKNTVNVYGNLFLGNIPIVVGIVMNRDSSGNNIINNIRTVHARSNFSKQITDKSVLYLNEDKKKTRKWFQDCGNLNVPLAETQFGVIRSIAFKNDSVNTQDDGLRNSEKDTDYLAAVNRGDMETAQKMVDEAARKAGYRIKGHHGTGIRFTVFDRSKSSDSNDFGQGFYFSSSDIEAERYQKDDTHGDTYNKIYGIAYDNALDRIEKMGEDANDEMLFARIFNEEFDKELAKRAKDGAVISAYLKIEAPFVVSKSNWITEAEAIEIARNTMYADNVPNDIAISDWVHSIKTYAKQHDGKVDTDYFANKMGHSTNLTNALLNHGKYDGILDYSVRDKFGSTADYHAIALYSNQIKSADAVTYDDNGNVIPLSQRFNENETDIRYSEKDSDIDPLEVLRKQYGTIKPGESPFRVNVEVPKKTEAHKKVSQMVRTGMEAEATPDVALPTIEKMIADGQFSFEVLPDKEAVADAKAKINAKGWEKTVIEWFTEVGKGKVSKANTALGWVLYNNSVNAGDISLAMDILDALVRHQRNAAQALQATRILKKLSPEGQLYQAMRDAKRLEQEINERNSNQKGKKAIVGGRASKIITESTNEAIEKVNKTRTRTNGKRVVVEGNQVGEPFVFEYAKVVGENIAKNLLKRVEDKAPQKTFLKQLLDEIQMFANTKVEANKQGKKKTTAIDLLRDFIQNEQFYLDAWKAAQDEFYKKDVDDSLKEFIGTDAKDALYNNSIFTRALVEAAIATDEKASVIANQSALGFTKMAEQISNYLIKETGAEGEAAQRIRDAATAYVNSKALEGDKKLLAINRAINNAMKDIHETISTVVKNGNTEDVKTQIVKVLVGKYAFGVVEATNTAEIVEEQFGKMVEEYSKNKLESMFRKREVKHKEIKEYLTELGRLGAFKPGSNYNTLATQRIFKTDAQIKVNEELAKQLLEEKDENKRAAILEEIYKDIGRQLPSTFADKWNAWRYVAMLANVRTHVRNLAGNAIFSPLVMTKNAIATGIESLVYYGSGGQIERTKGIANKELVEAAKADIVNVEKLLKNNGKYNDKINVNRSIEEGRVIFQSDKPILKQVAKGAEFVRVKNSDLMDAEDALFSKPHYAYALASWCKVNGITPEMLKNPTATQAEKIAKGRDYAVKEALKATFRDTNDFSDGIAKLTKYYGDNKTLQALSMLGDGVMPFRRTPANIAVRAFEYSPVGFIKAITWNAVKLKQGKITAAEFIDNLAAGMTGTMITMLGVFLARLGVVVGAPADEEEKKMNDLRGYQKYSIVIGDRTFTLDWLAPESIPFFMGVNLYNISQEKMGWKGLITVIGNIGEPVLEMSCLSGIESAFSSISSVATGGFSELPSLLINSSVSYFTQAIPTLSGQLERSTQRESMMTYTENKQISNLPPDVQKILGKISAKIPGWDYNQIPYVDAWGRTEKTENMVGNFLNNVLNPAYVADIQETDMELELIRLYDATGEGSVLPDRAGKKFTVYDKNGNAYEKHLDAEEYVKYATLVGQNAYALMIAMTSSADYQALTDKEKVDAVKSVYDYSRAYSKEVFTKDDEYKYTMSKGYTNATKMCRDKKIPIESYLVAKVKLADIKGIPYASDSTKSMSNSASLKKMLAIMDIKGLSSEQRQALYEAFDIAEGVRHYTKAKIEQTLAVLEKQAKYK